LDELTQLLVIFDNFDAIVGPQIGDRFLGKWKTKWTAIEGVRGYFDKITEELVDSDALCSSNDTFLQAIGTAYKAYRKCLLENNRLDFAHQQKLVHDQLLDPDLYQRIADGVKYLMVDEYQDTNSSRSRLHG
jgi:superfamily I DNA/RNA helicase